NITFADPNITARFLSICAAAAVMLYSARRMPAWLAVSAGVACAVVQPMTLSRSGLVLFVVAVLLGAALAVDRRQALVFGVGLVGYEHQLKTTYSRFIPTNIPRPDTVSHTAFVTIAAEEGLAGLVLVLAFLVQLGREAWRWRRVVWVAAPAAMIVPVVLYSQFEGRFL